MANVTHKVVNGEGKEVGSLNLDPEVFGDNSRSGATLVHATVRWQLNRRRAGTHSTLTKGMMKGGNRKPWRQKGTGQARSGSNTSPVWVGGAVAHGPKPRSYDSRLSKRTRRQALSAILSSKLSEGRLVIVDSWTCEKTKEAREVLNRIGVERNSVSIVLAGEEGKVATAVRNIDRCTTVPVDGLNVYDLVRRKFVVVSKAGIDALTKRVKAEKKEAAA